MRIQVIIPLIIGLSACGIGSAFIYHYLKEQQQKDETKKTKSKGGDASDHPLTSVDVITCAELSIHNEFVPVIVGKDSLNLRSLEGKTRTKISFRPNPVSDDHHTCVIEGSLEAIEDARKIIAMIAARPVVVSETLDVSQSACGKIIGRCGEMLQEICRKSNAKVSVNSNETNNQRQVVITGTRVQVNSARALIEEKIHEDLELRKAIEESELKRERRGPLKSSALSDSQTSLPESIQSSTTNTCRSGALATGQMEVYVSAIASPSKFWLQMVGPQSTELDTLIEEMSAYYDCEANQPVHAIEEPCLDQIVASQFKWDNKWYRARIVAILPNEYNDDGGMVLDIYFLDYGDSAYVAPHEVFQLRADFLTLRFQAIECFLANVAPLDCREQEAVKRREQEDQAVQQQQQRYKWDRKAVERFEQLTHVAQWELLLCRVVCHEEKKRAVDQQQESSTTNSRRERVGVLGREGSPVPGVELYDVANGVDVNVGQQMIGEGLAVPTMYQKGGGGGLGSGGFRVMGGGSQNGSQHSSRTLSPVGFALQSPTFVLNGKTMMGGGGGGVGGSNCNQVAISENSSNENFENASYESRQQQMRQ